MSVSGLTNFQGRSGRIRKRGCRRRHCMSSTILLLNFCHACLLYFVLSRLYFLHTSHSRAVIGSTLNQKFYIRLNTTAFLRILLLMLKEKKPWITKKFGPRAQLKFIRITFKIKFYFWPYPELRWTLYKLNWTFPTQLNFWHSPLRLQVLRILENETPGAKHWTQILPCVFFLILCVKSIEHLICLNLSGLSWIFPD